MFHTLFLELLSQYPAVNESAESEPAPDRHQQLQPEYYRRFHCLADACPDTCCEGWRVGIDKQTYVKYRECSDAVLRPAFDQLVTINPARTSDDHYATFTTSGGRCSFLSEGLCSIQKRLGESYLGAACAAFPRVTNLVNGVLERSLDLSCPEAARLALLDPAPLVFSEVEIDPGEHAVVAEPSHSRIFNSAFLGGGGSESREGHEHVARVRRFVRAILQDRRYPLAKRLLLLGHVCDKLNEIAVEGNYQEMPGVLDGFACAIGGGLFDEHLRRSTADPVSQLGILLELIAERVKSDFTHHRFLALYGDFLEGLGWQADATLQQMAGRYADAYRRHYRPLLEQHEYVLEHYLVNNAFKTLFPFGSQSLNRGLNLERRRAITGQYILMTTYYAIVKAMLIGVAGHLGSAFDPAAAVRTIQICSKTFEHSISYPKRILEMLREKGITDSAGMAVLTQN